MKITRLAPGFFVSPQIGLEDLVLLREAGYRAVVNNRPDGEEPGQPRSADLLREAERLGLRYTHIPFWPGHMRDEDAHELARAIEEAGGAVLAFCRTGTRSTNLWNRSRQLAGFRP